MASTVRWGALSAEALSELPEGQSALKTLVSAGGCEVEAGSGIYLVGSRAHFNAGASTYLIQRDGGNVLVGCPKYSEALGKAIQEMGGIRWIVLLDAETSSKAGTWTAAFPEAERVMHVVEAFTSPNASKDRTKDVEVLVGKGHCWGEEASGSQKTGLWSKQKGKAYKTMTGQAGAAPYEWAQGPGPVYYLDASDELQLIYTPGSSSGAMCLRYKDVALFSGETLGMQKGDAGLGFNPQKSADQVKQVLSLAALDGYAFTWLLPGTSDAVKFDSDEERKEALAAAVSKLSIEVPEEYELSTIYSSNNEYLCA